MKRILFAGLLVLGAGCGPVSPSKVSAPTDADRALAQISEGFLAGYLAWRPQTGTSLGFHEYDGKLTDFSRASLDRELARLKQFDQQLAALKASDLSARSFFDCRSLQAALRSERFRFEEMESYTRNPMTYADVIDVSIYIKRNFAPLGQRVKSIIAIEKQAPTVMAAARANLAPSLPQPYLETAIDMAKGAAEFLGKDLLDGLKELTDASLRAEFNTANQQAISELKAYAAYLEKEKLPKASSAFALGRERFQKMLQEGEWIDFSPEQILEIGLRELRREQGIFAETARKIDATQKPSAVFKRIQRDHPSETNLIAEVRGNLEAIRQFVAARQIVSLPSDVRARVEETPQFMRATSFASMDTPGPFETKATEAYYYVTPTEKDWPPAQKEEWLTAFNYYTTDVVSIHEAYPGHYVQFLALNASSANKLEKIFTSYAFVEGWAHYTEQMMLDEGFPDAPKRSSALPDDHGLSNQRAAKYRLAQSDEALLRLCRLCVSIKLHCQGMTVEEATRFFEENCYYEHKPAGQEAIRGTFDPGYLYYTLGKLQILKLRRDYQHEQGAAYSLRKFHDELLQHGAPPIRLLREVMLKDRASWNALF